MADPTITAARQIVDESLPSLRGAIAGASPEALNWRPGEDMNTIAVIVTHAMHSTRMWLSAAVDAPKPDRDRPKEFLATAANADELLSFFDTIAADVRGLLDTDAPFEAGAVRHDYHRMVDDPLEDVTAAWALLHALEHLQEHVAHAQLTRQLWEQQADEASR